MARTGSTTLSLPPFEGATRQLMIWNIGTFFALAVLPWIFPEVARFIFVHFSLTPARVLHGEIWQLISYCFVNAGLLSTFFALFSLWFAGNFLESSFGARYVYETYFSSAIGGAIIATAIASTQVFGLSRSEVGIAPWAGIFGLLVVIAKFFGETEFLFLFVLRMKVKYLVAIYILVFTARLLTSYDAFNAVLQLGGGLCGYLYCRYAPRRGFGFSFTERYYALRNEFYRAKRRKAAQKFEVYMRKQNRDVHFDKDGKYVDPDDRDPNDKRWMN